MSCSKQILLSVPYFKIPLYSNQNGAKAAIILKN